MKHTHTILLAILAAGVAAGCGRSSASTGSTETAESAAAQRRAIRAAAPEQRRFEQRLTVQGAIECKVVADVGARVPGNLDRIDVDEGDLVEAGKTVLFQVDPTSLEKAVTIAEQDLNVARASLAVAKAQAAQAEAQARKALSDFARYERLHEQGRVSDNEFEVRDVARAQAEAAQEVAKAGVELAERRVEQAQAALDIARKNLADATVVAPIDGVVTRRSAEPGEFASVGKKVVRIEDFATREAVAFLPAAYHGDVHPDETTFRLALDDRDAGEHVVTHRSPTVDPVLRTFEIKGRIPQGREGVVPGNMAQLTLVFSSRQGLAVPASAVLFRRGRHLVFVVEDGRAVEREVEIGLANDGWREIVSGLAPGDSVVVEGQALLAEGDLVSVL